MRLLIPLIFFLFLIPLMLLAQPEKNFWHFGKHAGLDFTTTPPTATASELDVQEGTASLSDDQGQLLFYTDGDTVWNRNNAALRLVMSIGK